MCLTAARTKKYKSINEIKKTRHDKRVLLTKSKLNSIEFLISWLLLIQILVMMTSF